MIARTVGVAFVATALAACSGSGHVVADLSGPSWAIEGVMVDQDGVPQEDVRMHVERADRVNGRPFPFAVIATGRDGKFYFETRVDGVFSLNVYAMGLCMEPLDLGDMRSERRTLRVVVKSKGCAIIM